MKQKIGVVGLWHLGCIISAVWAKIGHSVTGFDDDAARVRNLAKGIPPLFEPGLEEALQKGIQSRLLSFSNRIASLSDCDFVFLSYDTPVRDDDSSDTSILMKSVLDLRAIMKHDAVLIVSSQSPVGFCSVLRKELKKKDTSLELAYSPENLRLGEAIECYQNPGRVILGTADPAVESKCRELFRPITQEVLAMSLESAETVKHGINAFLASSIVFANHLADICEFTGANIGEVTRGMKSDPRIGMKAYLAPGIGFSGGTLGRDLKVLEKINIERKGYAKLFQSIHVFNSERKESIRSKTESLLGGCKGKTIGVLGVTYKAGTSTLRRSLPLEIVDLLLERKANVAVFDPKADYSEIGPNPRFTIVRSIGDVARGADLLLLLTEWKEFRDFDWKGIPGTMKTPLFFDTKNLLQKEQMTKAGFQYHSIGNL